MKNGKRLPSDLEVEAWFEKAEEDELTLRSILRHRDGAPSSVCFFSQQMAEKYLKAFLVAREKAYPKIHPVEKLLRLCAGHDASFDELVDDAVFLSEFYAAVRYPGDYPQFFWRDAEKAFRAAVRIKEFVLKKIYAKG